MSEVSALPAPNSNGQIVPVSNITFKKWISPLLPTKHRLPQTIPGIKLSISNPQNIDPSITPPQEIDAFKAISFLLSLEEVSAFPRLCPTSKIFISHLSIISTLLFDNDSSYLAGTTVCSMPETTIT